MTRYRDRYNRIYDELSRADLQQGSLGLAELSLGPEIFGHDPDQWLGFYTDSGLHTALEKYGFYRDLNRLGFSKFRIETKTDDPDAHLLRLWSQAPPLEVPLVELSVRRDFLRPLSELADRVENSHIPVLTIDWLLLQNSTATFHAGRPPLPGQRFPGLGVGAQVLEMLRNVCKRLTLAGMANVPSYFHNAFLYSEEFQHFDPHWQGLFLALCRDLLPGTRMSVAAASWAIEWGLVFDRAGDGTPFDWFHQLMLAPISENLSGYFSDRRYHREVQKSLSSHEFVFSEEALGKKLAKRGIEPFEPELIEKWLTLY